MAAAASAAAAAAAAGAPECAICSDALQSPTSAPCGHNFCLECLRAWVSSERARGKAATCPVCRGALEQDAGKLKVNRDLEALLATLAAREGESARSASAPGGEAVVEIAPAALALERVIGAGAYGQVWSATWEGAPVAAKVCAVAAADADPSVARAFAREARALAALRHPNVLPLYGVSHLPEGRLALVLKLAEGGALDRAIHGGAGAGQGGFGGLGGGGGGGAAATAPAPLFAPGAPTARSEPPAPSSTSSAAPKPDCMGRARVLSAEEPCNEASSTGSMRVNEDRRGVEASPGGSGGAAPASSAATATVSALAASSDPPGRGCAYHGELTCDRGAT